MNALLATVDVPASSANLGSGFDSIAAALSLRLKADLYQTDEPGITVVSRGEGAKAGEQGEELILRAFREGLRAARGSSAGSGSWRIEVSSMIPAGRGLGSSAAVIVSAVMLGASIGRHDPGSEELLDLAISIEGHADNVSAAMYGGFTVTVVDADGRPHVRQFDPPHGWIPVLFVAATSSATGEMRAALPATISHADAVHTSARSALLTAAIATGDGALLRVAMDDRLHQPYRLPLLEGTRELIALAYNAGAVGAALSGAGPSVLAICDSAPAAAAVEAAFNRGSRPGIAARLRFDSLGARLTRASAR